MAKAKILNEFVVVESAVLTQEVLDRIAIVCPDALLSKDAEGCIKYAVASAPRKDMRSISQYGAVFFEGKAEVKFDSDYTDREIKDRVTMVLLHINAVEVAVQAKLAAINEADVDITVL